MRYAKGRKAIGVALSPGERQAIEEAAAEDHIPPSIWMRSIVMRECARRGIAVKEIER